MPKMRETEREIVKKRPQIRHRMVMLRHFHLTLQGEIW